MDILKLEATHEEVREFILSNSFIADKHCLYEGQLGVFFVSDIDESNNLIKDNFLNTISQSNPYRPTERPYKIFGEMAYFEQF